LRWVFNLGKSGVASSYGAAGSLIVLLLWVYYFLADLFFGAEFTQVYANRPFIPRMIVPEFRRRGLASTCDALDAKRFRSAQVFELIPLRGIGRF